MCGLIGYFGRDPEEARLVDKGLPALDHRGPDRRAAMEWSTRGLTCRIGHTRLRILDLSEQADQPLSNEDGTIWVAFNGEIYNHPEIRDELSALGHRFATDTDTEVIVHLYEAVQGNPPRVLEKLRGMFAFAVWDAARGQLLLARDRLGIKPLYWTRQADGIAFSSEVRALTASGLARGRLDETSLADYLVFGHVRATSTPITGVRAVPPGAFISWNGAGAVPSAPVRWWNLPRPASAAGSDEGGPIETLRASLRDSVARHTRADRRVGVFLSGGVDSTVITSLAAEDSSIGTLTVTWPEVGGDESAIARDVARSLGVEHDEIPYSGADLMNVLPEAITSMDVPTSDGLNTWIVCSAARSAGFVVVLSGLGGDELFGGYPSFRQVPRVARASEAVALIPEGIRAQLSSRAARARPGGRLTRMLSAERGLPGAYACVRSLFSPQELTHQGVTLPFGPYTAAGPVSNDRTDTVGWLELENYLPDQLLRDADQMSMAHSLELRVPYLDDDVVAAALSIPAKSRLGVLGSKQILRDVVGSASHPKRPFTLPFDSWMAGVLKPWIRESILSDSLPLSTQLPSKFRKDLLSAFDERRTHWSRPWAVAILRRWIEARGLEP